MLRLKFDRCPVCRQPYHPEKRHIRRLPCGHSCCTLCLASQIRAQKSFTCTSCGFKEMAESVEKYGVNDAMEKVMVDARKLEMVDVMDEINESLPKLIRLFDRLPSKFKIGDHQEKLAETVLKAKIIIEKSMNKPKARERIIKEIKIAQEILEKQVNKMSASDVNFRREKARVIKLATEMKKKSNHVSNLANLVIAGYRKQIERDDEIREARRRYDEKQKRKKEERARAGLPEEPEGPNVIARIPTAEEVQEEIDNVARLDDCVKEYQEMLDLYLSTLKNDGTEIFSKNVKVAEECIEQLRSINL